MDLQTKQIVSNTALTFLSGIVRAKESGETLPPVLDKIAGLAIQGKATTQDLAMVTAREQMSKQFPWLIVIGLSLILLVVLVKKS